jgi:hemolysin III
MLLFQLREPVNAWSHGAGMLLAIPVTWFLWKRCVVAYDCGNVLSRSSSSRYQRIKALCLVVFGITLTLCYGTSAVFHGARLSGEPLTQLQRLDHVGIYFLIAGTYTPIAWGLMRGPWLWGTLTAAWTAAVVCGTRVLCGNLMPMWLSTLTYLVMGWGALFCYYELARTHSHRELLLLPLGGFFYSVGAVMNLMHWPALVPGVFAAHEIFHFFVITGTTCHVLFMLGVVIPSPEPTPLAIRARARVTQSKPRLTIASRRCLLGLPHFSWRAWTNDLGSARSPIPHPIPIRTGDDLATLPADNAEVARLA